MHKETHTSKANITPYKRPKKPVMSASERERQEKSLKEYTIGGGGDIA